MADVGLKQARVPWGPGHRDLDLPGHWPTFETRVPDLAGGVGDYGLELERALDHPVGGGMRLGGERFVAGCRVAIVVDDPSRWTPVREALGVVLRRLGEAGVGDDRITISVGVGRHQAVDRETMAQRVGEEVVKRVACFSPPVDELGSYVDLGVVAGDVPVRVFEPVARADYRILIGSVLPHLQAGFGGGWKLIFPGTSHRSTLGALHVKGLEGGAEGLLGSAMDVNPMRRVIREAAGRLPGRTLSISHVLGAPGSIFRVAAGAVDAVQEALAGEVRRRFAMEVTSRARVVVATNAPWPGDPMQSFKVLLNHRSACEPGGALVGWFWTDPGELARSMPVGVLRGIAASGGAGGWLIRRGLAGTERILGGLRHPSRFMVRWARELVVDRSVFLFSPELRSRLGARLGPVRLYAEEDRLWRDVERVVGWPERVQLFPWGGLSYVLAGVK